MMINTRPACSHHQHFILEWKKLVSGVCKWGLTASFLLVSPENGLPASSQVLFKGVQKMEVTGHEMKTAGRFIHNLPAIELWPVTCPVGIVGPSDFCLFGHVPHICQNWNVVLGIREFVTLFLKCQCIIQKYIFCCNKRKKWTGKVITLDLYCWSLVHRQSLRQIVSRLLGVSYTLNMYAMFNWLIQGVSHKYLPMYTTDLINRGCHL